MSSLKVEERFVVDAEVARVWEFLKRPELVAGCLPGAKLDGQEGGNTYLGTMKVKVGPVMQDFRGRATLTEVDDPWSRRDGWRLHGGARRHFDIQHAGALHAVALARPHSAAADSRLELQIADQCRPLPNAGTAVSTGIGWRF